jgi:hypothetical protein
MRILRRVLAALSWCPSQITPDQVRTVTVFSAGDIPVSDVKPEATWGSIARQLPPKPTSVRRFSIQAMSMSHPVCGGTLSCTGDVFRRLMTGSVGSAAREVP